MTDHHDDLEHRVAATRTQLFETLDAIEDKLNVPKQLGIAASKVKQGIDEKPVPYLAGLAAGVAVVGSIVAVVLRRR
ncbi:MULTISPECIES: DUF3618 domain-containing protein [unclassified Curtobacterium]|uniref:DUF3618 domain-containing protein n=1 Tax=unclassified Curtobacterium TaxID=257496 RepID=UPI0008249C61|nr:MULTISPECIES: DUF3618 domain-containing protein [unclassified Curtobacterium]WIA96888.1 DUF3618 domain-containing protein [Curtobacterium sp. MCBA15_004]WIB00190.1 DUF3618 domain-containing protein [Curtobacterium sp. MCBA15_012]